MYRKATNILLISMAFIFAARSRLIPSGLPTVPYQELIGVLLGATSNSDLNEPSKAPLPSSYVYGSLRSLVVDEASIRSKQKIIILVVLESLGFASDQEIDPLIKDSIGGMILRLAKKHPRLEVSASGRDYPLSGTLGAELRYLCNFREVDGLTQFRLSVDPAYLPSSCVPAVLSLQNFETHYIHDGSSHFYRRNKVMPLIGFSEVHFQDSGARTFANCLSKPFCGDDDSAYSRARSILRDYLSGVASDGKRSLFLDLMTIDTHAPYTSEKTPLLSFKVKLEAASLKLFVFLDWLLRKDLSEYDVHVVIAPDHSPGSLLGPSGQKRAQDRFVKSSQMNAVYILRSISH